MHYRLLTATLFTLGAFALSAQADTFFIKGRDPKGVLGDNKGENAKGVTILVKKATETIAPAEMIDIHYDDLKPAVLRIGAGAYKVAKDSEKESNESADAAKRKTALATAIAKYNETLTSMDKKQPLPTRMCRYKVATLMLRQAHQEKLPTDKAVAELVRYKNDFPDSWQINHVLPLIAQMQLESLDYKGASATYAEMALTDSLPAEVRTGAKLMIVQVAVRSGDLKGAQTKLAALEAEAAGNPKFGARVKMARAEILVGNKQTDEAVKILTDVIKESKDKDTTALAHNTLGECLYKANKFSEARWEFLWVETVFNQDRVQHAKALYYLAKTLQQLNDETRAQECRTLLLDAQFAGTEWQARALKEGK